MKRILFVVILLCSITILAEAKIYVCLDKSNGTPKGIVDINEKAIGDWAKNFVMVEADESYRGKQDYEIKYENQKLRHATDVEINLYKQAKDTEAKTLQKQKTLEELGLTEDDITKVKDLSKVKSPDTPLGLVINPESSKKTDNTIPIAAGSGAGATALLGGAIALARKFLKKNPILIKQNKEKL